jgi:UDP-3-O-[3-hydroxymyristoyl] glucosamine N-acyltransferase
VRRIGFVSPLALIGEPAESRAHQGTDFYPAIDPDATVEAFVTIDAGCEAPTQIGNSWLFKHSHVGHDAIIGDGCEISTGAVIGGYAVIADNVRIGLNATIRPRVYVGEGAQIGMGAVVTKNVPAGETWVGCPAHDIHQDVKVDPAWFEWEATRAEAWIKREATRAQPV